MSQLWTNVLLSERLTSWLGILWNVLLVLLCYFAYVMLRYLIVLGKRALLIRRIRRKCGQKGYALKLQRNRFAGIFGNKIGELFTVVLPQGSLRVTVLTTRFRRYRYHFTADGYWEVIRKWSLNLLVKNKGWAAGVPVEEGAKVVRRSSAPVLPDSAQAGEGQPILLVHPMPLSVTAVKGNRLKTLANGDRLGGALLYSASGLMAMLEQGKV